MRAFGSSWNSASHSSTADIMTYWEAILLGIVQGATEFLPVSSDGHLMIVEHLLGKTTDNVAFNVALHAGTLLSLLVAFRNDVMMALRVPRLAAAIIVATLPVIPVGLFGKHLIDVTLNSPFWAGVGLLITAAFLFATYAVDRGTRPLEQVRLIDALVVGMFQALAPAPGISRSGSTIFGGLLMGLERTAAARFAFLIGTPAIAGAIARYSKDLIEKPTLNMNLGPLLAGVFVSFIVGLIAIRLLMGFVQKRRLRPFAWYCVILGLIVIASQFLGPASSPPQEGARSTSSLGQELPDHRGQAHGEAHFAG